MLSSVDKIQKFFKLEKERGYDNRAVVGGLDKIIPAWEQEARANHLDDETILLILDGLKSYPSLEPQQRAEILAQLTSRLDATGFAKPTDPINLTQPNPGDARDEINSEDQEQVEAVKKQEAASEKPARQASKAQTQSGRRQPASSTGPRPQAQPARQSGTAVQPSDTSGLNAPLRVLQGVGNRLSQTLASLGLNTLEDLLYYFPRRYDDYSQLKSINRLEYGEETTVLGAIQSIVTRPIRGGKSQLTEAVVGDGTGFLRVTWFNQPWLANRFSPGAQVVLAGKIEQYLGRPTINNPDVELIEQEHLHTNRIVPVYSLTAGLTQKNLRRLMFQTITYWAPRIPDYMPEHVRNAVKLINLSTALMNIHFPESQDLLDIAHWRLAFDEIFLLQLGVLRQKQAWQAALAQTFTAPQDWVDQQTSQLPYALTGAQRRVLGEIQEDLESGRPMNRLVQGDVGSGKTVVAALAIAIVTRQAAQAAVLAPTSILAEQHYRSLTRLLARPQADEAHSTPPPAQIETPGPVDSVVEPPVSIVELNDSAKSPVELNSTVPQPVLKPEEIRLLLGDTPESEKEEIRQGLENGAIRLVIGTHALFEDNVRFQRLQLAVIDEQHRFGVAQRATLRSKGENPHLLVMTATPIPRSLALTVYGDLDLSVMDEMPPGRQPVDTFVLRPIERERAYHMIRTQVEAGHQAFIVYPLVEQKEDAEVVPEEKTGMLLSAVEEHSRLQKEIFPKLKIGLLHGRMKPEEKDAVMRSFRDREFDILVSTTVIEVGVDIPNASVMLIEGANRFGLAQLHQLRGRVGRGSQQSFCLLIPDKEDGFENERLAAMAETNDGFVLAEKDLQQRGPGEFLGTRQAGYSELKMANLTDVRLIEKARQQAQSLFKEDGDLSAPENQLLLKKLEEFWGGGRGDIS